MQRKSLFLREEERPGDAVIAAESHGNGELAVEQQKECAGL